MLPSITSQHLERRLTMNQNLLTIPDLCQELGIGKSTVYKLLKEKQIKSTKIGSRLIIRRDELEHYINKKTS